MKKLLFFFFFLASTLISGAAPFSDSLNCGKPVKIVVLGSSTTYGKGATPIDSAWVYKFTAYVQSKNSQSTVVNLGVPGYCTYHVLCPAGYVPPANRPAPDDQHNITKALSLHPDAIIINLPSNDIAFGYTVQEQKDNYERTMALADAQGVPVWVTTTQPRTNLNAGERTDLKTMRDWTNTRFGAHAIDFWTTVANDDGSINSYYDYDGVHVNNAGHLIFYNNTVNENILDSICLRNSPPVPVLNQLPVVNAGADQTIILPVNNATLQGSASDADGTISNYLWSQLSGPSAGIISSPSSAQTTITGLTGGTYAFELKATDDKNGVSQDTILVQVNAAPNQVPLVNAGEDMAVTLPVNIITLNGYATDADGSIATYTWSTLNGPSSGTITTPNAVQTTVTNLQQGTYNFILAVIDNKGATATDTITVVVQSAANQLPVASAGVDQTVTLPLNSVAFSGSGTDADGTITGYLWKQISGPSASNIGTPNAAQTAVTNLVQGIYSFELAVTDNAGTTTKDTVNIIVKAANLLPTVSAGADKVITLPINSVTLSGTGSDADGTIASYLWSKISGPTAGSISSPASVQTTITGLVQGIYTFTLQVTDNANAVKQDTVLVTVNPALNKIPVANAGTDKTITLPASSVSLTGSGTDADGTIASYTWSKVSGPATGTIMSLTAAQTTVSGLTQGTYLYQLVVKDNAGAAGKDTVKVIVNPASTATTSTTKYVKVNLYGGTNAYTNTQWNNWNIGTTDRTGIASGLFKYSDGTASNIKAVLSHSQTIGDNGSTYKGGMAPAEVLRYMSYSTLARTLTISGLATTKQYSIELYASRYSIGNSTIFTINNKRDTVYVFDNYSNKAVFTNISPNAQGQIVVSITKLNNYSHLNGFALTEQGSTVASLSEGTAMAEQPAFIKASSLLEGYPNPFASQLTLHLNNSYEGPVKVQLVDVSGAIKKEYSINKDLPVLTTTLSTGDLSRGTYLLRTIAGTKVNVIKVVRL